MKCSRIEKSNILERIYLIFELNTQARRRGILSLEDSLDCIEDFVLRKGIQLVADGIEPETVEKILWSYICSCEMSGITLLNAVITLEGILEIQEGVIPSVLIDRLISFLGNDMDLWDKYAIERNFQMFSTDEAPVLDLKKTDVSVDGWIFSSISRVDDLSLQKILREISPSILAAAIKGTDREVAERICNNLSHNKARALRDDITYMGYCSVDRIEKAQKDILRVAQKLYESGDILISPNM